VLQKNDVVGAKVGDRCQILLKCLSSTRSSGVIRPGVAMEQKTALRLERLWTSGFRHWTRLGSSGRVKDAVLPTLRVQLKQPDSA